MCLRVWSHIKQLSSAYPLSRQFPYRNTQKLKFTHYINTQLVTELSETQCSSGSWDFPCICTHMYQHEEDQKCFVCMQVAIYLSQNKLRNVFMHEQHRSSWASDTEQMHWDLSFTVHVSEVAVWRRESSQTGRYTISWERLRFHV